MVVATKVVRKTPLTAKVDRAGKEWAAYIELPDGSSFGRVRLLPSRSKAISKARADLASLDDLLGV